MSLKCKACSYEMTTSGFLGFLTAELFQILKARLTRGTVWENYMGSFANHQKLACPECEKYVSWVVRKSDEKEACSLQEVKGYAYVQKDI